METTLTTEQAAALKLFGVYTAGSFDAYMLTGGARASSRAHIMSALRGTRVPQAKAGVNVIRESFLAMSGVSGSCIAAQEDNMKEWARAQVTA